MKMSFITQTMKTFLLCPLPSGSRHVFLVLLVHSGFFLQIDRKLSFVNRHGMYLIGFGSDANLVLITMMTVNTFLCKLVPVLSGVLIKGSV